jgi:hypothetical protein
MKRTDPTTWPLIDARALYLRRLHNVCCDVPLPDETLPIMGEYRMTQDQWDEYREMCGQAERMNRKALAEVTTP